jgi:GGDEF domain-containing protein
MGVSIASAVIWFIVIGIALLRCLRPSDVVGLMGGYEFKILLPDMGEP